MTTFHDEIEIEDMEYDEDTESYYYPCPCGDRFQITKVNDATKWDECLQRFGGWDIQCCFYLVWRVLVWKNVLA